MLDLSDVFAEHDIFTPRGYANECCHCGSESDLSKPPEGQGHAHLFDVLESIIAARVADAAARAEVIEALTSPEAIEAGARALKNRNHAAAVYKFHRWDAEVVAAALRNLLASPVDHAHAADGTEVGA